MKRSSVGFNRIGMVSREFEPPPKKRARETNSQHERGKGVMLEIKGQGTYKARMRYI